MLQDDECGKKTIEAEKNNLWQTEVAKHVQHRSQEV